MFWLKISFLIFIISCGFKPIYSEQNDSKLVKENLSRIIINVTDNYIGNRLSNILEDKFRYSNNENEYILNIIISQNSLPLTIQKNNFINHYNAVINANVELKSIKTDQLIYKKFITNKTEYHAVNKLFANYVAQEDAFNNNIEQVSEIILKDLIMFFIKR